MFRAEHVTKMEEIRNAFKICTSLECLTMRQIACQGEGSHVLRKIIKLLAREETIVTRLHSLMSLVSTIFPLQRFS